MYQMPFVVVVDNEEALGIYDPRFYRRGILSFRSDRKKIERSSFSALLSISLRRTHYSPNVFQYS